MNSTLSEPLTALLRRKRGNLRKKEIAALLNIPFKTYEKYESGASKPRPLSLAELLRRLNDL